MKNTETLVDASKENGLEVNVDNTKYMVMPGDQNAGLSHNIKTDKKNSFEGVEPLKYLRPKFKYENYIQEEIKMKLKLGNVCYHSMRNFCLPFC